MRTRVTPQFTIWVALVSALALLNYGSRASSGRPAENLLYTWSLALSSLFLFGIVLGVVLLAARSDRRGILALRRPDSWGQAAALAVAVVVGITVLELLLDPLLHPGREQGLTPSHWEPSHAKQFALNFVVIVLVAPVVEELTFRGLGYSVLRPFGRWTAILLVGLSFGLAHGLVQALPLLAAFGAGLAYLRDRTRSVYPGMVVHASYNALALILAVTT